MTATDNLIPLAFIICFFGGPFLLIGFFAYLWSRTKTERYKTVREYLNRGLPVPPELLRGQPAYAPPQAHSGTPSGNYYYPPQKSARRDLRRGITRTFAGMAICVTFYFIWPHSRIWAWGLIPWIIGVGYIVAYFVEPEDEPAQSPLPSVPPPRNPPPTTPAPPSTTL
jgi:hypothetical protein